MAGGLPHLNPAEIVSSLDTANPTLTLDIVRSGKMTTIKVCTECETVVEITHKNVTRKVNKPYKELMAIIGEWVTKETETICKKCRDENRKEIIFEKKSECNYILPVGYCQKYCMFNDICKNKG